MQRWKHKVAVVTGASSGIGAACCKYLVENGMIVVGLARRSQRVLELRSQLDEEKRQQLHAIKCDIRVEDEIRKAFAEIVNKFGTVAVLVNNAGVVRDTELVRENNTEDLRAIIETNVMGVALCTREAFRLMQQNDDDGHVVNINSIAGHKVLHFEGMSTNMYPASKHAVTAMTEVYRQEFLKHNKNVKVTSISPGVVNTEIYTDSARQVMENYPFLQAEDVADAVIYCLQTPRHVQIHELTIKPVGEPF